MSSCLVDSFGPFLGFGKGLGHMLFYGLGDRVLCWDTAEDFYIQL